MIDVGMELIESGLYETLQFPFSYLSGERDIALVRACAAHGMGFIAMKGLAGGLITNSRAAMAYMLQYDNVLPIWGIQRMTGLEEWLSYMDNPPHFHAEYGGHKCLVDIQRGCVIKGALPSRQLKLVLAWAEIYRDELMQNWELAKNSQKLIRIAPI